ncbi:hypothetical protein CNYM01_05354 [Colletotrichum nymphaeae SA-01]|uniref:Uncharacterized protein n=1 Tax=Colletotrichum nymphaeae SA-01 TaxID=1460502 RepID=A0A135TC67_9PEZI|nr:hypothetical protein CNYM01_05354 [Colletotrichum nymphaeae SA-01]
MPADFAFVTVSNSGRTQPTDRSVIRSRCMIGKNRQEGSRRSKQAARKVQRAAAQTASENAGLQSLHHSISPIKPWSCTAYNEKQQAEEDSQALNTEEIARDETSALMPPVPHPPPSDMSLIRFAEELERPSQEILFRLVNFNALKGTFYPIEHCVDLPRSANSEALSFSWILQDKIFLHSALFYSSAVHEHVQRRQPGRMTQFHLRRTIKLLNEALSQPDSHRNEAIFHVILTLALMAGLWGDLSTTAVHMSGLRQIVRLRGGLRYLRSHPKLHFKLDRLALSWSLGTGGTPYFFTGPISWKSCFDAQSGTPTCEAGPFSCNVVSDWRLAAVWQDLRHLVNLINNHLACNSLLDGSLFQDSLGSIQMRLVHLQNGIDDRSDECLRLGMLAFLSTTLQIPGGKFPYKYLTESLRNLCETTANETIGDDNILFWLLMVCAISVFEAEEAWLRPLWLKLGAERLSWDSARSRLQAVMWIDRLQGELGSKIWAKLALIELV